MDLFTASFSDGRNLPRRVQVENLCGALWSTQVGSGIDMSR
jgi:hypothetical protein